MKRALTIALLVAAPLLSVQAGPVAHAESVRAGVPLEAVTPPGMALQDTQVHDRAGQPVRLSFAEPGAQQPSLVVDVHVADDTAQAVRTWKQWRRTTVAATPERERVGDRAFGGERMMAFVRDNVAVALRRVRGQHELLPVAHRIDRAITNAPAGPTQAQGVDVDFPSELPEGVAKPIAIDGDVVATRVHATGAAYARRTRSGWVLIRTREGPFDVGVVFVDSRLRTGTR